MRDTLEDLYFGKITPNEQDITPGSLLANAMDQAEQCEEKLTARLEGEEKTLLLRLLNAENEISSTMALENYILGFRLGMRIAIESLDEGEAGLAESSSGYYVVRRLPIADAYETVVANENDRYTLLAAMKSEEFNDYVIEQSASLDGIELNQEAIDSIRLSSMVTDSNRNGTVSAASSTSSTTEESSSSQVSSEESSASSDAESSSSETSSTAEE